MAHITIPRDIQDWTQSKDGRSIANIAKHSGDFFAPVYPVPPAGLLREAADKPTRDVSLLLLR